MMSDLRISLIQPTLLWENKAANFSLLTEKISSVPDQTAVIVLPEMFSTGFSMNPEVLAEDMDGPSLQWMKQTAAAKKCILTGSLIISDNGEYFNRLIWMLPNGKYGIYDKRHLFAFAGEHEHYSAGKKRLIGSVNGWRVNLQVCYDLRFPAWIRQQDDAGSKPEYDLLIIVANWPAKRSYAWKILLLARAIENQCYVVAVNRTGTDGNEHAYTGGSLVIDPLGNILHEMEEAESVYTHSLDKQVLDDIRTRFPFWKDADDFSIQL